MKQAFIDWLLGRGYAEAGAGTSYPNAITLLSNHYSENTNEETDIFLITDQHKISEIAHDYSQSGQFAIFGNEQHARFRNAIARYSEFFVNQKNNTLTHNLDNPEIPELKQTEEQINFAYERDLQTTLCAQVSDLFPNHEIFKNGNKSGIEYSIEGKRIDVLLEHEENKSLLAVELKSGVADFRVFGQISMYLGLLKREFPNTEISGVIIAGSIDKSLQYACETSNKVSLRIYRMNLELEEV